MDGERIIDKDERANFEVVTDFMWALNQLFNITHGLPHAPDVRDEQHAKELVNCNIRDVMKRMPDDGFAKAEAIFVR